MERILSTTGSLVIADVSSVEPGGAMHQPMRYTHIGTFTGSSFEEVNQQIAERLNFEPFSIYDVDKIFGSYYYQVRYKATDDLVYAYEVEKAKREAEEVAQGNRLLQRALDQFHALNPAFKILEQHGYTIIVDYDTLTLGTHQHRVISAVDANGLVAAFCGIETTTEHNGDIEIKMLEMGFRW
jgi:hypothetical protein